MKKYFLLFTFFFSVYLVSSSSYAVTCWPSWNGTRTVEGDCDYPVGHRVYGDIIVGPYTVNVTSGTLGIDLTTNKITFTTGKIMFYNGKADGSVWNRYNPSYTYYNGGHYTCPAGTRPLHNSGTRLLNISGEFVSMPIGDGTYYCGK